MASGILTHVFRYLEAACDTISSFTHLNDFPQCKVSGVLALVSLLSALAFLFLLPEQQFRFLLKGTASQVFNERMYYLFNINMKYKY